MTIRNFILRRTKSELSPLLSHLSSDERKDLVKLNFQVMDHALLESEGITSNEYLTPKLKKAVFTILSFLSHEGFSHVEQNTLCKKAAVSIPTMNNAIQLLVDLEIIHSVKVRNKGKQSGNVYVLISHPNYLKIVEYLNNYHDANLIVSSLFSQNLSLIFSQKKNETPTESKAEPVKNDSKSINSLNLKEKDIYIYSNESSVENNISQKSLEKNIEQLVDSNPIKFATSYGIPEEFVIELAPYFNTTTLIDVWNGLSKTLKKYDATFADYKEYVSKAVSMTLTAYTNKKNSRMNEKFNFTRGICGATKKLIKTYLEDKLTEYHNFINKNDTNLGAWLYQLTDSEKRTAFLIRKSENSVLDLPY